jgi:uncharacterized DUF497 family protein
MRFEFDPAKSAANKMKHGIDFVEAQTLWLDPNRVEIPARISSELRWQMVAQYGGKTWSAFVTHRGDAIRIISVRRARREEEAVYAEA